MSSNPSNLVSSISLNEAPVIALQGVGQTYKRIAKPTDRFWQAVWPSALRKEADGAHSKSNEFVALAPLNLTVQRGEALGLIGRNGVGRNGMLSPTKSSRRRIGRPIHRSIFGPSKDLVKVTRA